MSFSILTFYVVTAESLMKEIEILCSCQLLLTCYIEFESLGQNSYQIGVN